ncbi:hypothetical protein PE067_01470 [Paracoccus sp. DMF-8]|uniref:hypothetical protein n=1 Tax=Paracoccus sp. DMF-8 TaxID=3019445 RepID=UPI0023E8B351|nr:hypothetical protein [Paracoccus sp. DMF-8]MDF3604937.1 hypothetical protein [Paracoccus sp. DMF-8]
MKRMIACAVCSLDRLAVAACGPNAATRATTGAATGAVVAGPVGAVAGAAAGGSGAVRVNTP